MKTFSFLFRFFSVNRKCLTAILFPCHFCSIWCDQPNWEEKEWGYGADCCTGWTDCHTLSYMHFNCAELGDYDSWMLISRYGISYRVINEQDTLVMIIFTNYYLNCRYNVWCNRSDEQKRLRTADLKEWETDNELRFQFYSSVPSGLATVPDRKGTALHWASIPSCRQMQRICSFMWFTSLVCATTA
jgi:hypothetical protein